MYGSNETIDQVRRVDARIEANEVAVGVEDVDFDPDYRGVVVGDQRAAVIVDAAQLHPSFPIKFVRQATLVFG